VLLFTHAATRDSFARTDVTVGTQLREYRTSNIRSRSRSRATSVTLWTTRRIKDATFPVRVAFKKSLSRVQRAARLIKCKDQARVVADFTDAVARKRINRSCDTCIVEISTRCNETLRRITDPSTRSERSCARARARTRSESRFESQIERSLSISSPSCFCILYPCSFTFETVGGYSTRFYIE